jgi:hypothetical protein
MQGGQAGDIVSGDIVSRDIVAHIADIHFWRVVANPFRLMNKRFWGNLTVLFRRRHEFIMSNAEPFADAIAATGAADAVLTGDFSSTSMPEEFEMAARFVRGLRDRGLRIHILPGNHDVYTFGAARTRQFEKYFGDFIPAGGYPSLTSLKGGTPLILVPTVCPRHFSASGLVTESAVKTVSGLLQQCASPVIVAGHYPLLHRTEGYVSNRFRQLENADLLRRALAASGKEVLYIAGHVHRFSFTRDAVYPNIQHLTTGALFRADEVNKSSGDFTEIRAHDAAFKLIRHTHDKEWSPVAVE